MLDFAKELALGAGKLLRERLPKHRTIETKKTRSDLVTDADKASENWLVERIKERYPEHAILGEEGGGTTSRLQSNGYLWVIDPLDGTVNYTHHLPMFAVSIGLLKEGRLELGVIYIPILDELFAAQRGKGATLNGEPIRVSDSNFLKDSILATGFPYDKHLSERNNSEMFTYFLPRIRGIRRMGAASIDLAYVAAGRLTGYWEEKLKPWDIVAGALIVEEAGGRISGYDGFSIDWEAGHIVASNGKIHEEMLRPLSNYAHKYHFGKNAAQTSEK